MTTINELDTMTRAYLTCALWSSTDENDRPFDDDNTIEDFAPDALKQAQEDCKAFASDNADDLADIDSAQAGHDFWLTRNRHGAGFWDRGLGEIGKRLTDAAHAYGSCDVYRGDDDLIYLS
jgi:hypothetical protein